MTSDQPGDRQPAAHDLQQALSIVSTGYDAVYAAASKSPTLRRLWHEHAEGPDFPEAFGHISFTTLPELQRVVSELRLNPGDTVVDLGCGMAGPALWVARETGARLVGIDLSAVAVEQAAARARDLGLAEQARFAVGSFAESGLDSNFAPAAMSEDALQYVPSKAAALAEAARILRPGGRLVFTAYELEPSRAANVLVLNVDPVEDYRPLLMNTGFSVTAYEEVPGWPEPMTTAYSAIVNARSALVAEMGEAAAGALLLEMSMTLEHRPYRRRVLAAATKE